MSIARTKGKIDKLPSYEKLCQFIRVIHNEKHKVLVLTALETGLRLSEVLNINLRDIDFEERTLTITHQKNGNDNEKIPLLNITIARLVDYIHKYKAKINQCNNFLFFSTATRSHISRGGIWTRIYEYRKLAGFNEDIYGFSINGNKKHKFSFHSLRHYYINDVANKMVDRWGMIDTNSLRALSRHKNPQSLNSYLIINDKMKRKITDSLFGENETSSSIP